jgi:hypothetical protein
MIYKCKQRQYQWQLQWQKSSSKINDKFQKLISKIPLNTRHSTLESEH